jgi:magnesium transporter
MLLKHLLKPEILELIEAREWNELRAFLMTQPAPEIAELLGDLGRRDRVVVFRLLPRALAGEAFALLDPDLQNELLEGLASEEVRELLSDLSPDDRTALFEELPASVTQRLLVLLPDSQRRETLTLLSYPENSVGRLMTTAYVTVRPEWTAAEAIEHLRRHGRDSETLWVLYVTDEHGRLTASVSLRRLILAPSETKVADLMEHRPEMVLRSLQDREEALRVFRHFDVYALPVTDEDGVLLGIVTIDDILDVADEETTEDFHKLAKVVPIEGRLRRASFSELFRKRVGWLIALVFVNVFSGAAMAPFEGLIHRMALLISFLPLLIGSSGNAGSQTATLVVRALALGEIRPRGAWRLLAREAVVGLGLGLAMGAAVFLLGCARGGVAIGVIAGLTMVAVVALGCLIGLVLPLGLYALGFDPAAAGVPLITSLADISGILVYFSTATVLLDRLPGGGP